MQIYKIHRMHGDEIRQYLLLMFEKFFMVSKWVNPTHTGWFTTGWAKKWSTQLDSLLL